MNRQVMPMSHTGALRGYLIPILSAVLFVVFVGIALISTFVTTKGYTAELIRRDVKNLVQTLQKIDDQCNINGFSAQQNPINFLNVRTFEGSEVCGMNLVHPDKWQGPYLKEHPEVQNIRYMVVCTRSGYFVTPGNGVKLPNGKIIGTDIKLDENTDIDALMSNEKGLAFEGKPLAARLELKKSPLDLLNRLPLEA